VAQNNTRGARSLVVKVATVRFAAMVMGLAGLILLSSDLAVWFKTPAFAGSVVWIAVLAVALNLAEFTTGFLTALLQMRFVSSLRTLGIGLSIAVAVILFASNGVSVHAALLATISGWVLVAAASAGRSLRIIGRWPSGFVTTPPSVRYGLTVWAGNLFNSGLSIYSSVFLLGVLASDPREVGLYNAAVLPVGRLWTLMVAGMATIMLPALAEVDARQGAAGLARFWHAYSCVFALLLVPTYSFLLIYAHPLVRFAFGETYNPAARLMQVYLALALVGTLFAGTVTINLFYATGRQWLVVVTSGLGGLLDLGLLLFLIPRMNALGAVIGDGVAGSATGAVLFLLLRRNVPGLRYPVGLVAKTAGASLGGLGLAALIVPPDQFASMLVSMAVGGALFLAFSYLLKPLAREDLSFNRLGPRVGQVAQWFGAPLGATCA
jgi:O-antigen/teichoic acid export membrane protein